MQVTCKKRAPPIVFQKLSLVIEIETDDELNLLIRLFGHNESVPKALFDLGGVNYGEMKQLEILLDRFHHAINP